MRKKKIKNALNSRTPANSMYALIPKGQLSGFKKFAALFGFTEDKIQNVLSHERKA